MVETRLLRNDRIIDALRRTIKSGAFGLDEVPQMLKVIITQGAWRERVIRQTGEVIRFERFADFVATEPPEGLGADIRTLQRLCADDREALDLLDQVSVAGPGNPTGTNQYTRAMDALAREAVAEFAAGETVPLSGTVDNINSSTAKERPDGTSATYALRKLRRDRPDLHARVLAGELSPHGAMVEAGFRKKTITVPLEPAAIARSLRRHLSADEIAAVVAALEADR